ncbi:hypothetical protein EBR77_03705 [bacterium]|nr:hypothetical protein [bacterium]NBX78581.1 hypothetical protein [bacterium]
MKSVVQEGTTIIKAIESAYNKAGNPSKFFIKVLEYPQSSFWGLGSSKSAKIALFFEEVVEEKTKTWDKVLQQKEYEHLFKEVDILMPDPKPEFQDQEKSDQKRSQDRRHFHNRRRPYHAKDRQSQDGQSSDEQNRRPLQHNRPSVQYTPRPLVPKQDQSTQGQSQAETQEAGAQEQPKRRYNNRRRFFKRRPKSPDDSNNSNSGNNTPA